MATRAQEKLKAAWSGAWPAALAAWSKFARLREPVWCLSSADAAAQGLTSSFAMIRFADQVVVINLELVKQLKLEAFALQVLAHEIGHHILAPANLDDHARCIARMRWALPTLEAHAPMIANLYTDLLINDRLHRGAGISQTPVFQALPRESVSRLWALYMRTYEVLWSLQKATLANAGALDDRVEGDAQLAARLVRAYAGDWVEGSGRFAALCLPYLLEDQSAQPQINALMDTRAAGVGGLPAGLVDIEDGEREGAIHPALDPALSDGDDTAGTGPGAPPDTPTQPQPSAGGQRREPFQFGELLKAMGVTLDNHDIAARYYRERALPYLIKYPTRVVPETAEPQPEGYEPWDIGQPLDQADWLQTAINSPRVVPGLTTVQRVYGTTEGTQPERRALYLDLYVDSSGSMPNPQVTTSFLTLAGAIICLSALRAGARVQATLWSGKSQHVKTDGFVRDEREILRILTGFYGGGTQFPIHVMRDTYASRGPTDAPVHVLIISDDGVTTLFGQDERGNQGWDVARASLKRARGGGTMVLNLPAGWDEPRTARGQSLDILKQARAELGWRIHRVATWDDLTEFARRFSRETYAEP